MVLGCAPPIRGAPARPAVSSDFRLPRATRAKYDATYPVPVTDMHDPLPLLARTSFPPLRRSRLTTLQVNLGYRCNQTCVHCHVNAGPKRTEEMTARTAGEVIDFMKVSGVATLDLTGGAPEIESELPSSGRMPRWRTACGSSTDANLTILLEPGQEDLAEFLAARRVGVVASLPCYLDENVDRQRGTGGLRRQYRGTAPAQFPGLRRRRGPISPSTSSSIRRVRCCRRRRLSLNATTRRTLAGDSESGSTGC